MRLYFVTPAGLIWRVREVPPIVFWPGGPPVQRTGLVASGWAVVELWELGRGWVLSVEAPRAVAASGRLVNGIGVRWALFWAGAGVFQVVKGG